MPRARYVTRLARIGAALLLGLLFATCAESGKNSLGPLGEPQSTISDAANSNGRAGFYFLPPMVPNPGSFTGTFDPTLAPEVRICQLVAATPPQTGFVCGAVIQTLTTTTGASERITVDERRETYNANWQATDGLQMGKDRYRLEVYVGAARLGFADLWPVKNSKQLKNVTSAYVGLVVGSPLQVKFRIETGVIGAVTVAPATDEITGTGTTTFTATVTDLHGNPVSGATVDWSSSDTNVATVSPASATTNGAGQATTVASTATQSGTTTITAASGGAQGAATLTVTLQSAPVAVNDSIMTIAGNTLAASVFADNHNGPDTLGVPSGSVTSFGGGSLGGSVTDHAAGSSVSLGGGTLSVAADGSLTFSPTMAGVYTFQYRLDNGIPPASDATVTIAVIPGAASKLAFTVQPSTTTSGQAITPAVQVAIQDANGNTVTSASSSITLAIGTNPGGGTLSGTSTVAAVNGVATFSGLSIDKAGTGYTLTASSSGLTAATSVAFDITAGGATKLAFVQQPTNTAAGASITPAVTVAIQDANGNSVTSATDNVAIAIGTNPAGGTLSGTATVAAVNGVATFAGLSIDKAGTGYTLTASSGSLTGATSTSFDIGAGAAANLVFTVEPSNTTAGQAITPAIQVTIQDANGNTVTTASSSITLAIGTNPGSGTLSGTATVAAVNGVATFAGLSIDKAGTGYTLTASSSGLTGATSAAFDITAGAASKLAFTVQPSTTTAGQAITPAVQVTIQDALGNTVTTASGSITLAIGTNPGGGTLSGTATQAASSGVATFADLSIDKVGTGYTLTASSSGLAGATSAAFDIAAGPLHHFRVEAAAGGAIPDQVKGTPFDIKVTALDQLDNTVTTFTGTVDLTTTPAGGLSAGGGTSPAFTAGVLASHSVTFGSTGTFTITATRTSGSESGTSNSFDVEGAPTALDDGPSSAASAPGDSFHTALNTSLSPGGDTPNLLANDDPGFPVGTIASFGAIESNDGAGAFNPVSGTVTSNAAGSTVSPIPGYTDGSLQVNGDGGFTFTPPTNYTGLLRFKYRLSNTHGTSDATVTIAVGVRPSALADDYSATHGSLIGNVTLNTATGTAFSVKGNDAGDRLSAPTISGSATGGSVTLNPDGTFTFLPDAGFSGTAGFSYTVSNGFGTTPAVSVSLTVSANRIWFVDRGAASNGTGTQASPFQNLSDLAAVNGDAASGHPQNNDALFLYQNATPYSGTLTLRSGQKLIGQDAGATLASITGFTPATHQSLPAMSAADATLTTLTSSGATLTLGSGNTLRGFTLGDAATAISGNGFGTLTVADVAINTSGQALSLTNGTLAGGFTALTSRGGTNNVLLSGVQTSGTATLGTAADSLVGASSDAFKISGQNGSFTYAGKIRNSSTLAVNIAGKTGGTVTISGDINPGPTPGRGIAVSGNSSGSNTITFSGAAKRISTGAAAGVTLSSNAGATIAFLNGGLDIATTTGAGFSATGGGTVSVAGSGNRIASTGGVALEVSNTTIGASGLTFLSISANGGANGIVLTNTGSGGGLTVTGDGTAGSGGTIQHTTGADGGTTGTGIYLSATRNVSLSWMQLNDHANWAIRGVGVVNFTMSRTRITGVNGTTTATDDGSVYFTELTGAASITGSLIDGGFEDGVLVSNTTGTLDRITFDGDTIGSASGISGDGVRLEATGTATLNATIQNTRFQRAAGDLFQHNIVGNAQSNLIFQNNTLTNNHPAISSGGGGVTIDVGESGDLTYDINGNTFRGAKGPALVVTKAFGGLPGNGTMTGKIRNNVIGTAGPTKNGSSEGSGMLIGLLAQGSHTTLIQNNQIYDYDEMGIFFNIGGTSQSVTGLTHNGTLNATVIGNTIAEPLANVGALAQNGIHLNAGTNSTGGNDAYNVCLDIGGAGPNTLNGSGALGGTDIRLRQRFATTVKLPGYTGANNDDAAVQAYVVGRNNNPGSTTASASNTVPTGGGFINTTPAGSACPQP